jgi:hypothetical protein
MRHLLVVPHLAERVAENVIGNDHDLVAVIAGASAPADLDAPARNHPSPPMMASR